MKIYLPEASSKTPEVNHSAPSISLDAILPRPTQPVAVIFMAEDRLQVGDVVNLLWQPPLTAINGWGVRPSEIAHSFLVSAEVVRVRSIEPAEVSSYISGSSEDRLVRGLKHDLEVISCERFLRVLSQLHEDEKSWELQGYYDFTKEPPSTVLFWEDVFWCGTAVVDGLTYIQASARGEAHLQLITYEGDGDLFGLYSAHLYPVGSYYNLGRRKLADRESQAVRRAMQMSCRLTDMVDTYLST